MLRNAGKVVLGHALRVMTVSREGKALLVTLIIRMNLRRLSGTGPLSQPAEHPALSLASHSQGPTPRPEYQSHYSHSRHLGSAACQQQDAPFCHTPMEHKGISGMHQHMHGWRCACKADACVKM